MLRVLDGIEDDVIDYEMMESDNGSANYYGY